MPIEHDAEQDSHDFEKCLRWLERRQADADASFSVVALGAFGGRLDHTLANVNMAYCHNSFERFVMMNEECLAFLLPPGMNVIEPNREVESGTCGFIPVGGRCDNVRTSGLRWDLDGRTALEFGSLVSSSNEVIATHVCVENSSPLLWISGLL